MPHVGRKNMTPAQAATAGYCPECGHSMAGVDPVKHAASHYGHETVNSRTHPEAAARQKMLRAMAAKE